MAGPVSLRFASAPAIAPRRARLAGDLDVACAAPYPHQGTSYERAGASHSGCTTAAGCHNEHLHSCSGSGPSVRARLRRFQSDTHRPCRSTILWIQTRARTRNVVTCALRCQNRRSRFFGSLHAGCGVLATDHLLRRYRAPRVGWPVSVWASPARLRGRSRPSAR
jgi:hypothetical protein